MATKVVSNTGPIIHLTEIGLMRVFDIFKQIIIPEEVRNELRRNKIQIPSDVKVINLENEWKDLVKVLTNQHDLDLGEAQAIALALQEKTDYFFTDDLEAREVSRGYHVKVHGTVGLILRAFREKVIDKKEAVEKIKELQSKSSLFITKDLIEEAVKAIEDFVE